MQGSQLAGDFAPWLTAYRPDGHSVHSWAPAASAYVPAAQSEQEREEVAPVAKEYVPGGQGTHGEPE